MVCRKEWYMPLNFHIAQVEISSTWLKSGQMLFLSLKMLAILTNTGWSNKEILKYNLEVTY